jgi:hypothetical protein
MKKTKITKILDDEMNARWMSAIEITVRILELLPDELRQESIIAYLRRERPGYSESRDWNLLMQGVTMALAFRAVEAARATGDRSYGQFWRVREFGELFYLAGQCGYGHLLGHYFDEACGMIAITK